MKPPTAALHERHTGLFRNILTLAGPHGADNMQGIQGCLLGYRRPNCGADQTTKVAINLIVVVAILYHIATLGILVWKLRSYRAAPYAQIQVAVVFYRLQVSATSKVSWCMLCMPQQVANMCALPWILVTELDVHSQLTVFRRCSTMELSASHAAFVCLCQHCCWRLTKAYPHLLKHCVLMRASTEPLYHLMLMFCDSMMLQILLLHCALCICHPPSACAMR